MRIKTFDDVFLFEISEALKDLRARAETDLALHGSPPDAAAASRVPFSFRREFKSRATK